MTKKIRIIIIAAAAVLVCVGIVLGIVFGTRAAEKKEIIGGFTDNPGAYRYVPVKKEYNDYTLGHVLNIYKNKNGQTVYLVVGKEGYAGNVQMLIALENDVIVKMQCYASSETKKSAEKIFNDGYYAPEYYGRNLAEQAEALVLIDNDGNGDISKSGATKTSNAVLNAVNALAVYLNNAK